MTDWTIFTALYDILIQYYFGSSIVLASVILLVMLIGFLSLGVPLRYVAAFLIPLAGGLTLGSWFGTAEWVLNVFLIVVGILYSYSIIKMTSG
jgi:hypothetical protein